MEDLTSAVTMLGLVCWPGSQDQLTYSSSNVRAQPHLRAWAHTKAQLCPQAGANSRAHKHKPKPTPRLNFNMVPITVQISHVLATKEHVNVHNYDLSSNRVQIRSSTTNMKKQQEHWLPPLLPVAKAGTSDICTSGQPGCTAPWWSSERKMTIAPHAWWIIP